MRTRRLVAMLPFRDELPYLRDWFDNVLPHVDGVVALDDGSVDGSASFVARQPKVLEVFRRPRREAWRDGFNHQLLAELARAHRAEWVVGIDADERLERHFRERALAIMDRAEKDGNRSFFIHLRDIWDEPDRWRADGPWGGKKKAVLFRPFPGWEFDPADLHGVWAPLASGADRSFAERRTDHPTADLIVYHLRMLNRADRERRRNRYLTLDPERRWQSIGYEYLADESGLELARLPDGRDYIPRPR